MNIVHVNKQTYSRVRGSLIISITGTPDCCHGVTLQTVLLYSSCGFTFSGCKCELQSTRRNKSEEKQKMIKMWRWDAGFSCCDDSKLGGPCGYHYFGGGHKYQKATSEGWQPMGKQTGVIAEKAAYRSLPTPRAAAANSAHISTCLLCLLTFSSRPPTSASGLLWDTQSLTMAFRRQASKVLVLTDTHLQITSHLRQIITKCPKSSSRLLI